MVIVAPHLLKDKGSVRLRPILFESENHTFESEEFVSLELLAPTIEDRLDLITVEKSSTESVPPDRNLVSERLYPNEDTNHVGYRSSAKVECIYVEADQYYGHEKMLKGDSFSKKVMKIVKTVSQRYGTFINGLTEIPLSNGSEGSQVIASGLPFWVLRDFGTFVMKNNDPSTIGAGNEMAERYPKHKKVIKTLCTALDYLLRRHEIAGSGPGKKSSAECILKSKHSLNVFLFSIPDDRFDLITLGGNGIGLKLSEAGTNTRSRGKEKGGRR